MLTKIRFRDQGQDFLEWEVAPDGSIINSTPCQAVLWTNYKVTNLQALKRGSHVDIADGERSLTINYPVKNIEVSNEKINRKCRMCSTVFTPVSKRHFKCTRCGAHMTEFTASPVIK